MSALHVPALDACLSMNTTMSASHVACLPRLPLQFAPRIRALPLLLPLQVPAHRYGHVFIAIFSIFCRRSARPPSFFRSFCSYVLAWFYVWGKYTHSRSHVCSETHASLFLSLSLSLSLSVCVCVCVCVCWCVCLCVCVLRVRVRACVRGGTYARSPPRKEHL